MTTDSSTEDLSTAQASELRNALLNVAKKNPALKRRIVHVNLKPQALYRLNLVGCECGAARSYHCKPEVQSGEK